ncbi:cadherin domain-containing protein, partial [Microvirga flavescens]|uniref:cadherin domain-containing protein n=1 Tax=Microvirga flavescens TaxID=2249811 RepID=UPI0018E09D45
GKFEIVGNELRLKAGAVLDYETATSHTIKITVTDNHGASVTKSVTIHVGDVDENRAPTGVTLSRDTVDEGTTGLIATLDGVDPDTGDTFTYALAEDLSGKFEIVGNELRLKAGAVLDYETATSHTIKITVTDNHGASVTKSVTIHVGDVDENRAPTGVTLSRDTVDEGTTGLIATLTGLDPDTGDTFTYALAEDPSGKFEIVGNELRLKAGAVLDYETATSHTIKITVTDNHGASVTKSVTIHVGDVDENRAPTGVTLSRDTVDEGTTGLIATLTGVDPDTGDTFTYALAEDLSGKFEIVGNELRLKAGAVLDYETATSHTIKITVTDNHGASVTKSVTIHVGDVDENRAPTGVTLSRDTVDEGITGLIATLTGVDPDTGDTFTYALAEDLSGKFEIVGNELRLKAGAVLDYETATSHTIKITVTDNHGASVTKSVTIHVGDVDENRAPTGVTLSRDTVDEGTTGLIATLT